LSSYGICSPILALKSPHIMVVSWGCVLSSISSSCAVAWASVMFLLFRDAVGGMYTFMTLTRWLFGSITFVNSPYSLPIVYSIAIYFFTYVIIPPLLPFRLLSSTKLYPGNVGGNAVCAIHVSYTHSISTSCFANIIYSFMNVRPRMFMLAIVTPCFIHFCMRLFMLLFLLLEPFVRFILCFSLSLGSYIYMLEAFTGGSLVGTCHARVGACPWLVLGRLLRSHPPCVSVGTI
jgi:hypothetical protein